MTYFQAIVQIVMSRIIASAHGLQKRGIRFKLADLPEVDQLTIHILAAMAQHEARMIAQRTRQALQIAKTKGITLGNPYLHYQRNLDTQSATQARSQKLVDWKSRIYRILDQLEAQGITTCQALTNALNQRQLRTYSGKPFTLSTISRLKRERHTQ